LLAIGRDIGDDRGVIISRSATFMETAPTTSMPPAPAKPRRRWWRWALAFTALVIAVPLGSIWYANRATQQALDEAEAEAERDLPRWRLLELEADRPVLGADENSALHIIATNRMRGPVSVGNAPNYEKIFKKLPANVQLNEQQARLIRNAFAKAPKAVEAARRLKDMPRGRFPIAYSDDFVSTLTVEHQEARGLCDLLKHDAMLLAHEAKYDEAILSCLASFNLARSMNGDLITIPHLIRGAIHRVNVDTLERVLAQGTPSDRVLQALQAEIVMECNENHLLTALRGERAGLHHRFEKDDLFGGPFPQVLVSPLGRNYPEILSYMNRTIEVAKLPLHERGVKLAELTAEVDKKKNIVSLLAGPVQKLHEAECRTQALLRSAAVALACERYRLAHKDQWPATLEVLVQEKLLGAIPLDPFDGRPLRIRPVKDGIVVYSVGKDLRDNGGHIDRDQPNESGVDIGLRLWDVEARRQPPLPPVVEKEEDR